MRIDMEKVDLINMMNSIRETSKYDIMLGQVVSEIFMQVPKTHIKFGSYGFDSNEQKSVLGVIVNEHAINAVYNDIKVGSLDYVWLHSNDDRVTKVMFSRQCADRAYALYMFIMNGYRMSVDQSSIISQDLQGKTFEELMFTQQSRFRSFKTNCHEYNVFVGDINKDELDTLRKYLDEC